jgi:hypothetical protein
MRVDVYRLNRIEEQHRRAMRQKPFEFRASNADRRAGGIGQYGNRREPAFELCKCVGRQHGTFLTRWRAVETGGHRAQLCVGS